MVAGFAHCEAIHPRHHTAGGRKTWIIAAENLAELRGRGGYLGTSGTLAAENGKFTLGEFQLTAELPELPLEAAGQTASKKDFSRLRRICHGTGVHAP